MNRFRKTSIQKRKCETNMQRSCKGGRRITMSNNKAVTASKIRIIRPLKHAGVIEKGARDAWRELEQERRFLLIILHHQPDHQRGERQILIMATSGTFASADLQKLNLQLQVLSLNGTSCYHYHVVITSMMAVELRRPFFLSFLQANEIKVVTIHGMTC